MSGTPKVDRASVGAQRLRKLEEARMVMAQAEERKRGAASDIEARRRVQVQRTALVARAKEVQCTLASRGGDPPAPEVETLRLRPTMHHTGCRNPG